MNGITHNNHGGAIIDGDAIDMLRLTMLLRCLGMEIKGIKMVRHSVCAQVKREYGFKGKPQAVHDQLAAYVKERLAAQAATQADVDALLSVGTP